MTHIYPISTSAKASKSQISWESAAAGVEYLFIGNGGRDHSQITEGNHDFISVSIYRLNSKPQLDIRSGRYRQRYAVPK